LYTCTRVSLFCPNVVPVRALRVFSLGLHLFLCSVCVARKTSSVLTPRILVSRVCGMMVLFSVIVPVGGTAARAPTADT
jgi:hypothetical protein